MGVLLVVSYFAPKPPDPSYAAWGTPLRTPLLEINTADSAAWDALPGIGPATARRIVRYRTARGGQFYSYDQLARVWGMDTLLPRLRSFLVLDSSRLLPVGINSADSLVWRRLPAVGPSLARRIVRYRRARGGFRTLEDLRRVWGMDSLFPVLRPFLRLDSFPQKSANTVIPLFSPPRELNTVTAAELYRLVPRPLADRLVNYRSAAGGFDSLAQLRRLYGMTPTYYERLRASLYLRPRPDTALTEKSARDFARELGFNRPPSQRLNINTADVLALESLPHLGPALAQRIVDRRNALGFFHSLRQLEEVYGLTDSVHADLRQWLYIEADLGHFPHLRLNRVTAEELAAHPYLSYSLARRIVRYRQQHGPYRALADLQRIGGVDVATWRRLAPYLEFD